MIESDIPTIQNIQSLNIRNNGIYNITPNFPNEYITKAEINVDVPTTITELQNKTININQNGTEIVSADIGYDALGSVTINTNIHSSPVNTQEKTVNIRENGTINVNPDTGYALSKVKINTNVFTWDELVNQLPIDIDLTQQGKMAAFYVNSLSDTLSRVPYMLAYNDASGIAKQKVVASMQPFKIINSYDGGILRNNGNYLISFNNFPGSGNSDYVINKNYNAPVNNVKFRINVPKEVPITADAIKLSSSSTQIPFSIAGQWFRKPVQEGITGQYAVPVTQYQFCVEFYETENITYVNIHNNTSDGNSFAYVEFGSIYGVFLYDDGEGLNNISLLKTKSNPPDTMFELAFDNNSPIDQFGIQTYTFKVLNALIDYNAFVVTDITD